ncbi:1154_t:CDS:2 [Funneliformis caledonium]|uniref:1154_t:CDS:1 n=1 Tax=Funneliformis caledonium TaxID=1117310 RepID=A0A9N9B560_9GLOM|nr:1154_t:CDS:2 [Funneliformis caledonium]
MSSSSNFTIEEFHTLTEILALTGGVLIFLNGRNMTTLITLTVPAMLNLLFVLGVMMRQTQQTNKRDFRDWLKKNIIMTTIITILSMVDIMIMKLLVDITLFNPEVRKWILVAGIFNSIKKMSQVVLLILYIENVGLDALLISTLFTSIASLLFSIIYEIYEHISSDSEVSHIP